MAEGRIVAAGALADQGDLKGALKLMERAADVPEEGPRPPPAPVVRARRPARPLRRHHQGPAVLRDDRRGRRRLRRRRRSAARPRALTAAPTAERPCDTPLVRFGHTASPDCSSIAHRSRCDRRSSIMNVVFLQGRLSSDPVLRELSSGSRLLSLEVTTATDAGTANVPVAWFDPPAVPDWGAGTEVVVRGVVKRRFYRSAAGTQSRTEVVADEVCEASKRRQAQRLLERAVSRPRCFIARAGYDQARRTAGWRCRPVRVANHLEESRGRVHPARQRRRDAVEPCVCRCPTRAADVARRETSSIDRWSWSDRSPAVLRSLGQLYGHGRLANTGYLSILPVDQGIEHSAARRSPRTRCTSTRPTSSSWPSRVAATRSQPPSACSAQSAASTPIASRSSSRSTTTSC